MFGLWNVPDIRCLGMWGVQDAGCWGCGMFGK